MIKFFKKYKKTYFGIILGPFCPYLDKNEFSWKKGFCQFLSIVPKKTQLAIPEKNAEQMGRERDGQW